MRRFVTVQLSGGLGNQLFQYMAGLYLAEKSNKNLRVDVSEIARVKNNHETNLKNLEFPASYVDIRQVLGKFRYFLLRGLVYAQRQKPSLYAKFKILPKYHSSSVVGYDARLLEQPFPTFIRGYYQTWKYLHEMETLPFILNPGKSLSSKWLDELVPQISQPGQVAIHVRRGDFLEQGESWGVISSEFYRNSLLYLMENSSVTKVWVFSDSVPSIFEEFSLMIASLGLEAFWPDRGRDRSAEENLVLMSSSNAIVIANSTFSWWGATLGNPAKIVIAPTKWFRARRDPEFLIPDHWVQMESVWS